MIKHLIFFDMDDTLSDFKTGIIPTSARQALKALKARGDTLIGVASGRGHFFFRERHADLNLDCFVCVNGQCASYGDEIVREEGVSLNQVAEIRSRIAGYGGGLFQINSFRGLKLLLEATDPRVLKSASYANMFTYGDFFTEDATAHQLIASFSPEYDAELMAAFPDYHIHRYYENNVDIYPKTSSKLKAIEALSRHFDLELKDVIAFGDGMNDLEMIRGVGLGIAMGNARDEIKAAAILITEPVGEDGVYNACVRLGLIKEEV